MRREQYGFGLPGFAKVAIHLAETCGLHCKHREAVSVYVVGMARQPAVRIVSHDNIGALGPDGRDQPSDGLVQGRVDQ